MLMTFSSIVNSETIIYLIILCFIILSQKPPRILGVQKWN